MKMIASVALCALLPGLAAQGSAATNPKPAKTDILGLIDRAEKLHAAGSSEEATRELRRAQRVLHDDPRGILHETLEKTIADMLAKADPSWQVWDKAFEKSATELIKTSQVYRRRKWSRIADQLLADAARVSPALADRERRRAAKRSRGDSPRVSRTKKKSDGPEDLMPKFGVGSTQGWDIRPKRISSPPPTGDASHVLLGSIQSMSDAEVSMEVKRPDTDSQAAILFGANSYDDYFIFDVIFHAGTKCVAVAYHWKDPQLKELGAGFFHLPKTQRGDWLRYAIRIEGKKATFYVGGKKLFSVECDRKPSGSIGMHVSGITRYGGPVHYRKLTVIELSKLRPDLPESVGQSSLLVTIRVAEKLLAAKKNEDATLILLDAAVAAKTLTNETLRLTLTKTIRKLIRRADRTHMRLQNSRLAAAVPLVAAAKTYTEARWFLIARDILKSARELDPASVVAPLAVIDNATSNATAKAKGKAGNAKSEPVWTGGYPAEVQGETNNLDLLLMFEGGRQPYDKDAWSVSTAGISAPSDRLGGTLLLSNGKVSKDAKFTIQFKSGPKECVPGLAFGFKSIYSYYFLALWYVPKKGATYVQLYRVEGAKTKRVGPTKTLRFSADARSKWMTMRVELGEKKVRIELGTAPAFDIPVSALTLAGKIGLYTSVLDTRQPLMYRNLVIEKK